MNYYTTARWLIHTFTVKAPFLFLVVNDALSTRDRFPLENVPICIVCTDCRGRDRSVARRPDTRTLIPTMCDGRRLASASTDCVFLTGARVLKIRRTICTSV